MDEQLCMLVCQVIPKYISFFHPSLQAKQRIQLVAVTKDHSILNVLYPDLNTITEAQWETFIRTNANCAKLVPTAMINSKPIALATIQHQRPYYSQYKVPTALLTDRDVIYACAKAEIEMQVIKNAILDEPFAIKLLRLIATNAMADSLYHSNVRNNVLVQLVLDLQLAALPSIQTELLRIGITPTSKLFKINCTLSLQEQQVAILQNPHCIKALDASHLVNTNLWLQIVKENPVAIKYLPQSMLTIAFALQLVKCNGQVYSGLFPALRSDIDIAKAAFETAPEVVRTNCGSLNDNKDFVLFALQHDKRKVIWISARLQKDEQVLALVGKSAIRLEKQKVVGKKKK